MTKNDTPTFSINDVVDTLTALAYTTGENYEHMLVFASELTGKSIDALQTLCDKR